MTRPRIVPPPTISGHLDGFCLTDDLGAVIDIFPDWEGVNSGFRMACVASVLLAEIFANPVRTA